MQTTYYESALCKNTHMPQHCANHPLCLIIAQVSYCSSILQNPVCTIRIQDTVPQYCKTLCVPLDHRKQCLNAAKHLCVPPDHRAQNLNAAGHLCVPPDRRTQLLKAMKHLCVPPPQRSGHIALMGQSKHTQGQFPCCLSLPVTAPCAVLRESSSQQELR